MFFKMSARARVYPRRRTAQICIDFKSDRTRRLRPLFAYREKERERDSCTRIDVRRAIKPNGVPLSTKGDGFDPLEIHQPRWDGRSPRSSRGREFYFYCGRSAALTRRVFGPGGPPFRVNARETALYPFIFKALLLHLLLSPFSSSLRVTRLA